MSSWTFFEHMHFGEQETVSFSKQPLRFKPPWVTVVPIGLGSWQLFVFWGKPLMGSIESSTGCMGEHSEWELWLSVGWRIELRGVGAEGIRWGGQRRGVWYRHRRESVLGSAAKVAAVHHLFVARATRPWCRGMQAPRCVL